MASKVLRCTLFLEILEGSTVQNPHACLKGLGAMNYGALSASKGEAIYALLERFLYITISLLHA